jgi:hypothetical protein
MSDSDASFVNHALNQHLAELNAMKYASVGSNKMLYAISKAYPAVYSTFVLDANNETQIKYSKLVFNKTEFNTRHLFMPSDNTAFMTLAADQRMTPLITAALDAHRQEGGDPDAKARYLASLTKYTELMAAKAAEGPFARVLTRTEEDFIVRFRNRSSEERTSAKPNQNAVTYVYIMLKVLKLMDVQPTSKVKDRVQLMRDILKFFELYGDKTVAHLNFVLNKFDEFNGPNSNVNIKPLLIKMMESGEFVTSADNSASAKYLNNNKVSMKRLYRCVHLYTNSSTPWGLLQMVDNDDFIDNIIMLYQAENAVDSPDMKSLAMIWYLCIGRQNMGVVMVDHHSKNAANELAAILNTGGQDDIEDASYAFPFDWDKRNDFTV